MSVEGRPPLELPFTFEQRHVRFRSGRTGALVMTPRQPTVFGQDRLDAVRRCPGLSAAKEGMLCRIEDRESNTPILILRATDDDGSRLWEFDPDFSAEELAGVARDFVQSLLPFYRRVARSGIVLFVHSGWRSRDLATLRETVAVTSKSRALSIAEEGLGRLDAWIVRNMLMYSSLSLDHVLEQLLPDHLGLLSRRKKRANDLLGAIGPGGF